MGAMLAVPCGGAFTFTVPATGTGALGTGTSGRVAEWSGTNTLQASTLQKTGAGIIILNAPSGSHTLIFTTAGTLDLQNFLIRLATDSGLDGHGKTLTWSQDTVLSSFTAAGDAVSNGYVSMSINGVSYKLSTRA